MTISVIIPVYNRPFTLKRAVESVLQQSVAINEIIIVDDGSNDKTPEVIHALQQQHTIIQSISQKNSGVSAARNAGIAIAQSDWIAFLDSDDEWLKNKIDVFLTHIEQNSDCQLFHSDEIWIRNGVRVNAMKKHQKRGGFIFKHCLPLCVISPSASIIHKNLLAKVGNFDENLPACEDYDLWLRICHNTPVCYSEQALIRKYGGHDDQLSSRYWGMDRFRIRALHRLLSQNDLNRQNRHDAIAMLCQKTHILLKGAKKHQNTAIINEFTPVLEAYHCA